MGWRHPEQLYFPNGRLPGRWARWLATIVVGSIVIHEMNAIVGLDVWHPGAAEMANDLFWRPWRSIMDTMRRPLEVIAYAGAVVATLSPILRWRRANAVARRQIAIGVPRWAT